MKRLNALLVTIREMTEGTEDAFERAQLILDEIGRSEILFITELSELSNELNQDQCDRLAKAFNRFMLVESEYSASSD